MLLYIGAGTGMDFNQKRKPKNRFSDLQDPHANWFDDEENKAWEELRNDPAEQKGKKKRRFDVRSKRDKAFDVPVDDEVQKVELKINFSLPKFHLTKLKKLFAKLGFLKKLRTRSYIFASVALLLVIGSFVIIKSIISHDTNKGAEVEGASQNNGNGPPELKTINNLEFEILYPAGKNKDSIGKIVRISPEGSATAYAYSDMLSSTPINISQQKVPDSFKNNEQTQLEKTAKDFQATQVMMVDNVRVYHGSSTAGPQSLVFIKGNLLILIKSSQKITEETWAAYISALHS